MAQSLGPIFGTGKDGYLNMTADGNINTYCYLGVSSVANGERNITVSSISGFSNGDLIMIHKTRGELTTPGTWELNRINGTPSSTNLPLDIPLVNAYYQGGNDCTQIIRVPEYLSVTIPTGVTLLPPYWEGTYGGITIFTCNGTTTVNGAISAFSRGFRYGYVVSEGLGEGKSGEGTAGPGSTGGHVAANGNGGGGGDGGGGNQHGAGGGGGGNGSAGQSGMNNNDGNKQGGVGGAIVGSSDLSTMVFGGGGGGGAGNGTWGYAKGGGNGGGIIIILSKNLVVSGSINVNGGDGWQDMVTSEIGGGAGGAGGSVLVKSQNVSIGTNLITAWGGTGMGHYNDLRDGGFGGAGRVRIESNTISGITSPTYSTYGALVPWSGGIGIKG